MDIQTIYWLTFVFCGFIAMAVPYYLKCRKEQTEFDLNYVWGLVIVIIGSVNSDLFPKELTSWGIILVATSAFGITTTVNKLISNSTKAQTFGTKVFKAVKLK